MTILPWPWPRRPSETPADEAECLVAEAETPGYPPCSANAMEAAAAYFDADGIERDAYLDGARDGRVAGFCWGVLLTTLLAVAAYSSLVAR